MIYEREVDRRNEKIAGEVLARKFGAAVFFTPTLSCYDFRLARPDGQCSLYELKRRPDIGQTTYPDVFLALDKAAELKRYLDVGVGLNVYLAYWLADGLWRTKFNPPYRVANVERKDRGITDPSCLIPLGDLVLMASPEQMEEAESTFPG